jgi:NADPH-dependent 2,4-dienoyl-CoA reductase/sulfur reductase-like enzyme
MSHDGDTETAPVAKRIVIIGGVAGGMSTATRLRRLDAAASITVLERSGHVSFANCGLPYFVGGLIEEEEDLTLQTPEQLFDRFRLDVRVGNEVVAIDRASHRVTCRSTLTGDESFVGYDKLVLSMGAAPVRPPIPGYERVRTLRTVEDAALMASDVVAAPRSAVVIGAGFIGLEMAENLVNKGLAVTIVEATAQVLPPLDPEMAILLADELVARGVAVMTGATVAAVGANTVALADGRVLPADLVVGAIGVRPDVKLASAAGLHVGASGGLVVNEVNQTTDPDIYAVGDAVEKPDAISHATSLIALANIANRQGRRVADHIAGRSPHAIASLGTAIVKVFDSVAATVGWSEKRLRLAGRPFRSIHSHPFDHATYLPGRDPHVGEAHLRSDRRDHPRSTDRRQHGSRQADRRHCHCHVGWDHGRRARGPGACVCPTVLVSQGSRQHAGLHGRERAERRLRRRSAGRARRPGPQRLDARRRADESRARSRCHSRVGEHAGRRLARSARPAR